MFMLKFSSLLAQYFPNPDRSTCMLQLCFGKQRQQTSCFIYFDVISTHIYTATVGSSWFKLIACLYSEGISVKNAKQQPSGINNSIRALETLPLVLGCCKVKLQSCLYLPQGTCGSLMGNGCLTLNCPLYPLSDKQVSNTAPFFSQTAPLSTCKSFCTAQGHSSCQKNRNISWFVFIYTPLQNRPKGKGGKTSTKLIHQIQTPKILI